MSNMKTFILLASIASSMAQNDPNTATKKATCTGPYWTTGTLPGGVATSIEVPCPTGGPFYTTATLADGVVTTIQMPYSDGFYTTTVKATCTGPFWTTGTLDGGVLTSIEVPCPTGGPFYTTATLADGVVTTMTMPYSDGFYTATMEPTPVPYVTTVTSGGSTYETTVTPSFPTENLLPTTTSGAPGETFTGAAVPLHAGGMLKGGVAAAVGAVAYLL